MDDTKAEGSPFLNFLYKIALYLTASGQYSSVYGKIGRTIMKCIVGITKMQEGIGGDTVAYIR